jgi:hypothetical protein
VLHTVVWICVTYRRMDMLHIEVWICVTYRRMDMLHT